MRSRSTRQSRIGAVAVRIAIAGGATLAFGLAPSHAQEPPPPASNRVALVIGEGAYRTGALPAAPNDAGLVAQTLAGAGFDVTGARDLDGQGLRTALGDFAGKAAATGPDGIAVLYFAGRAVQVDGENYVLPVDARLRRPTDVPLEALRLTDITRALAALPIQAKVVVIDGAYENGPRVGPPGLALVEAEQGELLAFNAAPGTVAPKTTGVYGVYARSLARNLKQGGVPANEIFDRVRLSVDHAARGAAVPWDSDRLTRSFTFFDRAPNAPALSSAQIPFAALEKRPIRDFPPAEAYDVAVARDTLPAYAAFVAAFPDHPLARRVKVLMAVRREALFWRAAMGANSLTAFWTYLDRYPKGPHASDARRRLARFAVAGRPVNFRPLAIDVPPPPVDETALSDRTLAFVDPDLPPPPTPPVFLLPPFEDEPPPRPAPPPPRGFLPIPVPVPVPFVRALREPGSIEPPSTLKGDYPRRRPFVRGPNGDGLVARELPAVPGPAAIVPPIAPAPRPQPAPLPTTPAVPLPSGLAKPAQAKPGGKPSAPRAPIGSPAASSGDALPGAAAKPGPGKKSQEPAPTKTRSADPGSALPGAKPRASSPAASPEPPSAKAGAGEPKPPAARRKPTGNPGPAGDPAQAKAGSSAPGADIATPEPPRGSRPPQPARRPAETRPSVSPRPEAAPPSASQKPHAEEQPRPPQPPARGVDPLLHPRGGGVDRHRPTCGHAGEDACRP